MKNKILIAIILIIAACALVFNYLMAIEISPLELQQLLGQETLGATYLFPSGGGTGTSTNPSYGQMLVGTSGGVFSLVATSSLGITAAMGALDDISDVTITAAAYGDLLMYNGSNWVDRATSTLGLTVSETDPVWTGVSADYLLTSAFGTPFYQYFSATTTDALPQGSTNFYASQTRFDNLLSATSSVSGITTLPNLSILKAQVSDFGTYENPLTFSYPLSRTTNAISIVATSSMAINTDNLVEGTNKFMIYPGAGIALSTGSAWDTSITNNSGNWNTAYGWGNHAGLYDPYGQATSTKNWFLTQSNTYTGALQTFINASTTQLTTTGSTYLATTGGNVGIGTTSPYASLSVSGRGVFDKDIRANYFTATSTTNASTFSYASSTAFSTVYASSTVLMTTGHQIYSTFDKSFGNVASTTTDLNFNKFNAATTTFILWNPKVAVGATVWYCETTSGTVTAELGNGTASTTVIATAAGVEAASTLTWTARGNVYVALKDSAASASNGITCTATFYNQ